MNPRFGIRRGFTLLEVIVAITIGGLAVSTAVALLMGIAGRADAVQATAVRMDRDANAERLLRALLGNVHAGEGTAPAFTGDRRGARFQTWCEVPGARTELCSAHLFLAETATASSLSVEIVAPNTAGEGGHSAKRTLRLWSDFEAGGLLYLVGAADGGRWAAAWTSITLPVAIAVVLDADTLILPVR